MRLASKHRRRNTAKVSSELKINQSFSVSLRWAPTSSVPPIEDCISVCPDASLSAAFFLFQYLESIEECRHSISRGNSRRMDRTSWRDAREEKKKLMAKKKSTSLSKQAGGRSGPSKFSPLLSFPHPPPFLSFFFSFSNRNQSKNGFANGATPPRVRVRSRSSRRSSSRERYRNPRLPQRLVGAAPDPLRRVPPVALVDLDLDEFRRRRRGISPVRASAADRQARERAPAREDGLWLLPLPLRDRGRGG